jgi:hypothetical protein
MWQHVIERSVCCVLCRMWVAFCTAANSNCISKYHQCIQEAIATHKIMNTPTRNKQPLFKIANDVLVDLPTPSAIGGWWNFGSLLGICLVAQIITGLFLAILLSKYGHYIQQGKPYLSRRKLRMTDRCKSHSAQHTTHTPLYDMLSHHQVTHNDLILPSVFI